MRKSQAEVLVERAQVIANTLMEISDLAVPFFAEWYQQEKQAELDERALRRAFLETLYLWLHYIDRVSFSHLGKHGQRIFMDVLLVEFDKVFFKKFNGFSFPADGYNKRQMEYVKYRELVAPKGKGLKNTLFWEFGKNVERALGGEMPFLTLYVQGYISTVLKSSGFRKSIALIKKSKKLIKTGSSF